MKTELLLNVNMSLTDQLILQYNGLSLLLNAPKYKQITKILRPHFQLPEGTLHCSMNRSVLKLSNINEKIISYFFLCFSNRTE